MRRITTLGPRELTPWVFHADVLRAHVKNLCPTCHPSDCHICAQFELLPAVGGLLYQNQNGERE